jgi:TfoX/Sxy family transcriptional regulator of competence genes
MKMAFDEGLAERIRDVCRERHIPVTEKKMFGGLAFLLEGKLLCGIIGDELMARVGPNDYEEALLLPNVRKMDFTGRPLKGLVTVEPEGLDFDSELEHWLLKGYEFVRSPPSKPPREARKRK